VSSDTYFHLLAFTVNRHYDVIAAPPEGWVSEPFTLTGRNGYLYGRGVSDNKGPILAVACAASELLGQRALGLDLVFLIEGEEEVGSDGFGEAVNKHKVVIAIPHPHAKVA
jgi:di- and tripeptidase